MKGVERYFYWPRLKKDVEEFVRNCLVCQKVKFDKHKAQGLLQPLTIPTRPWESIAMDFIFDLPRTQSGHDGIWTIIDRFSKQAHFIPVKKTVKPDHGAKIKFYYSTPIGNDEGNLVLDDDSEAKLAVLMENQ
ncbi:hypothetical protein L7F22_038325 [Adiantum nelumboides]|nr:hypothetical protein [Adiantum nelumboides]